MTPEADTAAGFSPSAPPGEADDIIRAKASMAAEQTWEMQLGIGLSVEGNASVRGFTLDAGLDQLKCRCGIGSMAGGYEARGEQRAERERHADADHARHPAQAIEHLAQDCAAGQTTQEVAGEIEAAGR